MIFLFLYFFLQGFPLTAWNVQQRDCSLVLQSWKASAISIRIMRHSHVLYINVANYKKWIPPLGFGRLCSYFLTKKYIESCWFTVQTFPENQSTPFFPLSVWLRWLWDVSYWSVVLSFIDWTQFHSDGLSVCIPRDLTSIMEAGGNKGEYCDLRGLSPNCLQKNVWNQKQNLNLPHFINKYYTII